MNTNVIYFRRDHANFKDWQEVVVRGSIDEQTMRSSMVTGEYFFPAEIGLPDPCGDPQMWCELDQCVPTTKPPTVEITAAEVKAALVRQYGRW